MKIKEEIFDNVKYYFIDEYNMSFGIIYKFSNLQNSIYCEKIGNEFKKIRDKRKLKTINKLFYKIQVKDVI